MKGVSAKTALFQTEEIYFPQNFFPQKLILVGNIL